MLTSSQTSRRAWSFRLMAGLCLLLLLAGIVGGGACYLSGRARLARLKTIDSACSLTAEPVVPNWFRRIVGDAACLPLDRIRGVRANVALNQNLESLREFQDLTEVHLQFFGSGDCTGELLIPLTSLPHLLAIELEVPGDSFGSAGNVTLTKSGVVALSKCENLTTLKLGGLNLAENWCDGLKPDQRLNELRINSRDLTVEELKVIASLESLQFVELNTSFGKFELPDAAKRQRKEDGIWCVSFETLTPELVQALGHAKNLGILAIQLEEVEPDAFREFSHLSGLHALELKQGAEPVVGCIGYLGRCAVLEAICIRADELVGGELRALQSQGNLEQLILDVEAINPDGFEAMSKLTRLRSLRMHLHSNASAYGSESLRLLENLEEVDLGEGLWPVETLAAFLSQPKLTWLRFEASSTMGDTLKKLDVASPRLRAAFEIAIEDLLADAKSGRRRGRTTIEIGGRSLLPAPR